jgi:hypothetical protein
MTLQEAMEKKNKTITFIAKLTGAKKFLVKEWLDEKSEPNKKYQAILVKEFGDIVFQVIPKAEVKPEIEIKNDDGNVFSLSASDEINQETREAIKQELENVSSNDQIVTLTTRNPEELENISSLNIIPHTELPEQEEQKEVTMLKVVSVVDSDNTKFENGRACMGSDWLFVETEYKFADFPKGFVTPISSLVANNVVTCSLLPIEIDGIAFIQLRCGIGCMKIKTGDEFALVTYYK